jgi:hypothetical protein
MENYSLTDLSNVSLAKITPAKFREMALAKMLSSGPGMDINYMPTTKELDVMVDMLATAVAAGRFIDFGFWPNEFIIKSSERASNLYYEGALGHPFSQPWVFFHTWSDPKLDAAFGRDHDAVSIYLVNPFPVDGKAVACDFEITAIEPMNVLGKPMLCVGDRGALYCKMDRPPGAKYACSIIPVQFRFPMHFWNAYADEMGKEHGAQAALQAAGANIMEPAFLALQMLNTRGIPKETMRVDDRLNRARIKNKKPPIPPYTKVSSEEYITTFMRSPTERRASQGGTHASPVAHIRMGHWRHYQSGERTFINDTLVNADESMRKIFKSNRAGYIVKQG